ncbi:AsmA family protein [Mucilaginibacter pedocola]|uniref:AsmA family protein n=1 Tax=Mucilaginibacter pedocola TaxID=1792845 RepID=A0A1S9P9G5_9SPHI|nr:AsmA family protein [Mucilaginibacter pedocola]OOQ57559.1 AsmA family protein [Mucilaginibacter pedocola]
MPKWLKISLKVLGALILLVVLLAVGATIYVSNNKEKVLAQVIKKLNENLDGSLTVGDIRPSFFSNFPDVSLSLRDVVIRDRQFPKHHHTLLNSKEFNVSVNAAALLRGVISINNIDIDNAAIDLYTDSLGYSNTSVFKKSKKEKVKAEANESNSSTQLKRFSLANVNFTIDNQKAHKLFNFAVSQLAGKMTYPDTGWHANVHLNVLAKSLAFNTKRGSFIKNRQINTDLDAGFNEETGKISVKSNNFDIGGDVFGLNTLFVTGEGDDSFAFHLTNEKLLWRRASALLAPNIQRVLNKFNLDKPINVKAIISGSFGGGDPYFNVAAGVTDNKLTIPGAVIDDCNFDAVFTNENIKGKGFSDANSVIRLKKFSGSYSHLPFKIDTGSITNLEVPIATGNFKANFPVTNLNYLLTGNVAKFTKGQVAMDLRYKADVVNLQINKPAVQGTIGLSGANVRYVPRNLNLTNSSILLDFKGNDLFLKNIRLQSGQSIVKMEGAVKNFMNLYYSAPEKILIDWQVSSPQIYLGEFLGFLDSAKPSKAPSKPSGNSADMVKRLAEVLNSAKADMHMKINELHYRKFLAKDVKSDLLLSEDGIRIKQLALATSGGSLKLNGNLVQKGKVNDFIMQTDIKGVNVSQFFYAFDNFGLGDLTSQNLRGNLSALTSTTGSVTNTGDIVKHSIRGKVKITLSNGALLNFKPIKSVGKFAFPFRDLDNITLSTLNGDFDIMGDKITINPMEISSSVLNMDVAGVYGLTNGTDIALDVPLRNPKKDEDITDPEELKKRRFKGIVLHIRAHEEEGKLKIGWNKNHK